MEICRTDAKFYDIRDIGFLTEWKVCMLRHAMKSSWSAEGDNNINVLAQFIRVVYTDLMASPLEDIQRTSDCSYEFCYRRLGQTVAEQCCREKFVGTSVYVHGERRSDSYDHHPRKLILRETIPEVTHGFCVLVQPEICSTLPICQSSPPSTHGTITSACNGRTATWCW